MRGLIVEVSPVSNNTSIAHVRNSLYLKKQTGFDICWNDETILSALRKQYDVLVFSYSSKFAPHDLMARLIENNKTAKLFWMINEYNGSVPKCLRDAGNISVIANFDKIPGRDYGYACEWLNVDLNTWIIPRDEQTINDKKYSAVFYGTWRPGRAKYMKKYLQDGVYCSSSAKNHKFFRDAGCKPKFIEKLSWQQRKESLSLFNASLYIEDEFTHSHYNRMSNRFYEALYCNSVPAFDQSCAGTVRKSGYPIPDDWFIDDAKQLTWFDSSKHEKQIRELFSMALDEKITHTRKTLEYIGL